MLVTVTKQCRISHDGNNVTTYEPGEFDLPEAWAARMIEVGYATEVKSKKPATPAKENKAAKPAKATKKDK